MDEQREIITAFTEMAPRYERLMDNELNKFWGIDYQSFVAKLLSGIQTDKDSLILDIATGTSYIPLYLLQNNIAFNRVVGLDLTYGMLARGKQLLEEKSGIDRVKQVCASAHQMPFTQETFDLVICCLATHHMDVCLLLKNIAYSVKPGGTVWLADAGGSSAWKNELIKLLIKMAAFVYFLINENLSRAKAESSAIGNIHSVDEWKDLLVNVGFLDIEITRMKSKKIWAPDPLIIRAKKLRRES